jgi:hypothetical protein
VIAGNEVSADQEILTDMARKRNAVNCGSRYGRRQLLTAEQHQPFRSDSTTLPLVRGFDCDGSSA